MRMVLAIAILSSLISYGAEASIITFEGHNYQDPSASITFSGKISTVTHQGEATFNYFFGDFTFPPVFGSETVTGAASFYTAGHMIGLDEPYLTIDIAGQNKFNVTA